MRARRLATAGLRPALSAAAVSGVLFLLARYVSVETTPPGSEDVPAVFVVAVALVLSWRAMRSA